jgi:hypothetical protein
LLGVCNTKERGDLSIQYIETFQEEKSLPHSLTLELNADGDMVEDGVSVLTLDGLHLHHRINNT